MILKFKGEEIMKINLTRKFMAMLFTLCIVVLFVPIGIFAAEGDTNITEININDVSNELWSYKNVPFATVDESNNYTIESQKWYSSNAGTILPNSENIKPKVEENYAFIISLKAKDGYVFPIGSESKVFYEGVFKVNGNECDHSVVQVTPDGKYITALLFIDTKVKGVKDISGGNVEVKTSVRKNYTDCQVTDDINLKKGSDYIIDFTKTDNLSKALCDMADLEKTKYYKFGSDEKTSLIETQDASEALIKIVGNKSENKAIMTIVDSVDTNTSYALNFIHTHYTGSKLTYNETIHDKETGKVVIDETRDEYYTRYYFDCKLNLIVDLETTPSSVIYKIIEGENSSWIKNIDNTLIFRIDGDFSKFVGIKVDDSWVDSENYTVASGSTIVTMNSEYLKTLSADEHKITFVYTDGECSTIFKIKETENLDNPKTGDNSNILLWISLFAISFLGILVIAVYNRNKKYAA